jgi:hypothetical protein
LYDAASKGSKEVTTFFDNLKSKMNANTEWTAIRTSELQAIKYLLDDKVKLGNKVPRPNNR